MKLLFLLGFTFSISLLGFSQTEEDIRIVIQKCIDLPDLQPYYLEEPLVILDNGTVPNTLDLNRNTDPVKFYSFSKWFNLGIKKYLVFIKCQIDSSSGSVHYNYGPPPEEPDIQLTFKKTNGNWRVMAKQVIEN